ncbi:aspartate racemase [Alkalibacterium iburiense]|uniref:Aspartate racemase n=1 Tax=Alkalibacterium iburiense TaxID=290589 RepID=A0ABN0XSG5_9LACT
MEDEKVIGILGGMGPEATASLYMKLIKATPVSKDQDHHRVLIDSNPKIPDRTQAILYGGPSPLEEMIKTANRLEKAGATVIVMPCITAHYFYEDLSQAVSIPIYHVLKGLNDYIKDTYPHEKKIGVLSTTATQEMQLFQKALKGVEILHPNKSIQENKVMEAIYGEEGIKRGGEVSGTKQLLKEAANYLIKEKQCELIIGGCTEIELALKSEDISVPFIDPMKVAAEVLVKETN